ncbi:MAG: class I SAM-dependent methyltransferase [Bacteroidales bacterium]|nr:class I SAM-dependent methyltransferase [Bacteroidales bacterium]
MLTADNFFYPKKDKYVQKLYHGVTEKEQDRLSQLNEMTNNSFIDFLHVGKDDTILELGSGLGILTEKVSKYLDKGKITGIENSVEQLQKCPPETSRLQFVQGDVQALPFSENCCDKIYCRYVLEHVPNPLHVLLEAKRVLKQTGELFIQENAILLIEFYPRCPLFKNYGKNLYCFSRS